MLLLFLFALLAGAAAFLLFKFATVIDGDLTLVSRGLPRRERVDGKVVWITGASRGIGEVLAMQFANLGAKLILSSRNRDELQRVKQNILKTGGSGRKQATFNVNVFGTITLTRLLAPYMLDRGMGHFVVMSSAAGKVPSPGQAIYSASKHALNGYFASLRSELCTKGIKVTVVCPGPIETPQSSGASSSVQRHSSEKRVSVERCAELTIVAATHGLKEAWISYQPVLTVMYLVQYMPTIGYWLMDKVGAKRLDAAAKKGNTYSWNLIFGGKKSA
ncbi:Dehydrogenase/reductase SDR family member 7 [Dichanthelium oligosanthes]|uniref:Dehydrogenase/reductase SDR family member 7 n=1 Tax=Dichanthelium oligosanthes TaxID=888268 RepID=A0A1E5VDF2_9POAL|nr:Dehydrogenase/reductase SDR family member 7 [Dichanthelium oligosanthes]